MSSGGTPAAGSEPPDRDSDDVNLGTEPPTPAALIELLRRQPAAKSASRLRRHERIRCAVPSTVWLEGADSALSSPLKVITEDVSAGGFAFVCDTYLAVGTPINIQFGAVEGPPLRAVVRHCTSIDGTRHRVGARLLDAITAGRPKP